MRVGGAGALYEAATSMPPFAIERIDHVVLRASDLRRMEAFYTGVLGMRVARRRDDLGLIHLWAGASMLDLISVGGELGRLGGEAPKPDGGRNVDHLCLRVEPFDESAILEHLKGHGVAVLGAVSVNFGAEGRGPSLYVRDPEGNTVELKGPSQPRAATEA